MSRVALSLVVLVALLLGCARHVVVERDRVSLLNDDRWEIEARPSADAPGEDFEVEDRAN